MGGASRFERDVWTVIRAMRNREPPERRSFDRRPPYLGVGGEGERAPLPRAVWPALLAVLGLLVMVLAPGFSPAFDVGQWIVAVALLVLVLMGLAALVRLR